MFILSSLMIFNVPLLAHDLPPTSATKPFTDRVLHSFPTRRSSDLAPLSALLLTVTSNDPTTVTAPVPPTVPPANVRLGTTSEPDAFTVNEPLLTTTAMPVAERSSEPLTFTVAPDTASVPAPMTAVPGWRF